MPIRKPRVAVIDEATLKLGLSLEALGLWVHIQIESASGGSIDGDVFLKIFPSSNVDRLIGQLIAAGLLGADA